MHWVGPKHPETSWKVKVEISKLMCHQNLPPCPRTGPLIPFYLPNHLVVLVTVLSHGELNLRKPIKNYPNELRASRDNFWTIGF